MGISIYLPEDAHHSTLSIQLVKVDVLTSNHTYFFLFVPTISGPISAS